MTGESRQVSSNQVGIHKDLIAIVEKHKNSQFRKPIAQHTQDVFQQVSEQIQTKKRPIILDSGCGTGVSTRHIAKQNPSAWVIGIDRSQVRLSKESEEAFPENAIKVQADLVDFWRLAKQANWQPIKHYILYPNPYPKSGQLKRRWHAHPVFPKLLELGGQLELRTNWKIYAEEFEAVLNHFGLNAVLEIYKPEEYWTRFEEKYHRSGQVLYRCKIKE